MTEKSLVDNLLKNDVSFPWRTNNKIRCLTEVQVTKNRVDIVYFEEKGGSEIGFVAAVEAKLRDWRRALQQAYRDKLFADRVYVAVPEEFSSPAISNISEFRRASVGLIVVGDNGIKTYFHPPKNTERSEYHVEKVRSVLATSVTRS